MRFNTLVVLILLLICSAAMPAWAAGPPDRTKNKDLTETPTLEFSATPSPADSPSISATSTETLMASASPSFSPSPSSSPTPSAMPSATPSVTVTFSFTPGFSASPSPAESLTPAPSATATELLSQTPTPERSPAPAEILNLPASVLAPVPARSGEPVCLFGAAQPDAGHWELYGPDQQRLARLDFHSGERPCMDTRGMAPGVYYVAMHLDFAEASQDRTQAIVLLP